MNSWFDRRFQDVLGIEEPIIQAPMAGFTMSGMVIAVSEAGGLGSLGCATLNADQIRAELNIIRRQSPPERRSTRRCWSLDGVNRRRSAGSRVDLVTAKPRISRRLHSCPVRLLPGHTERKGSSTIRRARS